MAKIKVLYVERADTAGVVREVDNRQYREMQSLVGGYIEAVPLPTGHTLYCNEEGKLDNLPLNRVVTLGRADPNAKTLIEELFPGVEQVKSWPEPIHGPFFVCGAADRNGYDRGLKAADLPVLAKHLGIKIEGAA